MASDDTPAYIARRGISEYDAEYTRKYADFQEALAGGDTLSATQYAKDMAKIREERKSFIEMYNEHVDAQRPPPSPPELSQEEKAAKPISAMDYGDVWEMSQNSKYGLDEDAFRAGMAEVRRRKLQGG
jgi:hypothetical protein